jgi:hypothetical protein
MRAFGEWVILESEETKTASGIITNKGQCLTVVAIGDECPASVKDLIGEKIVFKDTASAYPIEKYMAVNWRDLLYMEE